MAKYNLQRIDLYVPQYDTDATITVNENHRSGEPHLIVNYKKAGSHGHKQVSAAIPADWTDQGYRRADLPSPKNGDRSRLASLGNSSGRPRIRIPVSLLEG